ncbi:hypothetical protein [Aquimarina algiphila]|uniref:Uncharacterized protein n=1 Tax=Aquimarina algiphila TaxID=2047982 RepID=A0A554VRP5_9FLAO|nr:hypothetical protein [Aquimarina algiphila]TSE11315.1 hypothetical protein FOF46_01410 [Aquimarina algiphila]
MIKEEVEKLTDEVRSIMKKGKLPYALLTLEPEEMEIQASGTLNDDMFVIVLEEILSKMKSKTK